MIFTRLHLKNLCSFKNFDLDLTFAKKPKRGVIQDEYLEGHPNFFVKKALIIAGANASGKTSFGRILCILQNFLVLHAPITELGELINDKNNYAEITAEFVTTPESVTHRVQMFISANNSYPVKLLYAKTHIDEKNSVATVRRRLDKIFSEKNGTYREYIGNDQEDIGGNLFFLGVALERKEAWHYLVSFPGGGIVNNLGGLNFEQEDEKVLGGILAAFDPSIERIESLKNKEGQFRAFSVVFSNGDTVTIEKDGGCHNPQRFSKGTFEAITVASFMTAMNRKFSGNCTFFIDEKMSSSHTYMEMVILEKMLNILPKNSQLFFTTHNSELLDMNLPLHTFLLLRKDALLGTEAIIPDENSVEGSLREAVVYDVFNTMPDTYKMDSVFCERLV